jgi:quercetin dioxygenase-like cupin family protein
MELYKPQVYPIITTGEGGTRQVLSETKDLMTVEFAFEKNGEGALHHHVHVQSTYVLSGKFKFMIDDTELELKAGDSVVIPSNSVHGCVALEAGSLIDTFTPRRDDFL